MLPRPFPAASGTGLRSNRSNVTTRYRPVAVSTRRASRLAFTLSGMNIKPNWQTTRSKKPSANGRACASAARKLTCSGHANCCANAMTAGLRSVTTSASGTAWPRARVTMPVPAAVSRITSHDVTPAQPRVVPTGRRAAAPCSGRKSRRRMLEAGLPSAISPSCAAPLRCASLRLGVRHWQNRSRASSAEDSLDCLPAGIFFAKSASLTPRSLFPSPLSLRGSITGETRPCSRCGKTHP